MAEGEKKQVEAEVKVEKGIQGLLFKFQFPNTKYQTITNNQ
jgi:hypothetical protein